MSMVPKVALALSISVAALSAPLAPAAAAQEQRQSYDLPTQPLARSLREVSMRSGRNIAAPAELLRGRTAPAVRGSYTLPEVVDALLAGSGLVARGVGDGLLIERIQSSDGGSGGQGAPSDEIVVTGTRIRGATPVGSNLVTLDRKDIDRSGYATTQQILAALPQNFSGGANEGTVGFSVRNNSSTNFGFGSGINLRGLGTTSTLTLVDGNRQPLGGGSGSFVDLTLIPSSVIERIEVLADGASAIYGSDAVAGVVNVRLRRDLDGAETRLRYGFADGLDEVQASQLAGFHWASGRFIAGYEYYRRGRLGSAERAYATEDLRAFGGPDYRQDYANPATIIAANGQVFGVPRGQNGTDLAASDLIPGVANLADGRRDTDLLPALKRHSAYAALEQDLGSTFKFRAQGFFADRRSSARYFPSNYGGVVVTSANPFYVDPLGTGEPVTVHYDFRPDLGPPTLDAHVTNWAGAASLDASFGAWNAELHGAYGEQRERQVTKNVPNYYRLALALADSDPATAYNLFGDGSVTSRATIERVRGGFVQTGLSRQWSTSLKLDGPLFALPAGDVRMAVGGEYRHEWYGYSSADDEFTPGPVDAGSAGFPLGRSVVAGYAELLAPLVGPDQNVPGVDRLDLSIAGRVESYSDFGTTANPRLGLSWKPVPALTLRGTFGTSFRAPSFSDIRHGPGLNQIIPLPLPDPASATGATNVLALFGNRPDIGPEKARTWTAGFDFRPQTVPGLSISATWFDISYRDRISNVASELFSFLSQRDRFQSLITDNPAATTIAALYADPTFVNPYGIPASAVTVLVDARNANLSRTTERGLDFDIGYRGGREGRSYELGVSGTWLAGLKQKLTATAESADVVSTIGNPVDLRLRARALATRGRASIAAYLNYVDGYLNNGVTPAEPVHSWTTVDFQLGYRLGGESGPLRDVTVSLSVTNLFDRAPPYVNNRTAFSAAGFDPENASPLGRMVAFQLVKSW
ncbi:TonB-dependent receptor [Sphingomonas paucimobilis]|uniref:TonB-dependent receptor n=1 Tax=Sphingomonas paucimobilis TaxID=13689 RepID=A0A7Y2KLY4_SPHPI|nr:TonB-dependent receptor [Sphingomonas paucimobilis]NNG56419.1 TonB-dependent receptor [Sphingomonas paucimobilis]